MKSVHKTMRLLGFPPYLTIVYPISVIHVRKQKLPTIVKNQTLSAVEMSYLFPFVLLAIFAIFACFIFLTGIALLSIYRLFYVCLTNKSDTRVGTTTTTTTSAR